MLMEITRKLEIRISLAFAQQSNNIFIKCAPFMLAFYEYLKNSALAAPVNLQSDKIDLVNNKFQQQQKGPPAMLTGLFT
jgi:hypothetical protein